MNATLILTLLAGAISAITVAAILRQAHRLGLVQHANHRSSHSNSTPTGGGVGIVLGIAICGGFLSYGTPQIFLPLVLALFIAGIGLIDDITPVAAKWRLLAQALAVSVILLALSAPQLTGELGAVLTFIFLVVLLAAGVWWVNLYNFLDGIDGYAASQGIFMALTTIAFGIAHGTSLQHPLIVLLLVTAAAIFGFLIFNWPSAKIFMGDVGSTFLGFWLWCLMLMSVSLGWLNPWQWLMLGSVFIADASVTLVVRISRGDKPTEAHKNHGYQKLSRRFGAHLGVVVCAIVVNVIFVLPAIVVAQLWPSFAPYLTGVIYVALAAGIILLGSGQPD